MVDVAKTPLGPLWRAPARTPITVLWSPRRGSGFSGIRSSPPTPLLRAQNTSGYGLVNGGREYNNVDVSWRQLRQFHMPAFRAAADAGVASVQASLTTSMVFRHQQVSGPWRILRGEWA